MIRLENLSRKFGTSETIREMNLEIRRGEIFTFIGPSGSGKTTLLRLIDLLDRPTAGRILFDGKDTAQDGNDRLAIRRRMGMVFQKPAVLDTTVENNVAFGLKFRGVPEAEAQKRVRAALELVGLPDLAGRRAVTLSGGEMQRVALARSIVTEPEVLLLDEPTANLDPVSLELIEDLIRQINRKSGTTIIMSTHDMIQGQRLADRIGVLMDGRLVQTAGAEEIFHKPARSEIARFVGIDTIPGGVITENKGGHAIVRVKDLCFEAMTSLPEGQRVILAIRPEEVTVTPAGAAPLRSSVRNQLTGRITKMVLAGPFIRLTIDCGIPVAALITRRSCTELGLSVGSEVIAGVKATAIHVIAGEK